MEANVDRIFGVGEYKKIKKVAYTEKLVDARGANSLAKAYELVSGYIPKRAVNELKNLDLEESLPGVKGEDIVGKYFK